MITVPQLFHQIARRSRTGDFTQLSLTEQSDLLRSANSGLQKVYNALPTYFKELTEGFVLPAPLALTGIAVTQFSATLPASTFTAAQLGATVRLDGDSQWNQVNGTDSLLNPYMGTTGTVNGTVYGDAYTSTTVPLDRIIGNPTFPDRTGWIVGPADMRGDPYSRRILQQSIGMPRVWWTQTFGNSQGRSPFVTLKFAPLPDMAYPVKVRTAFWPRRLVLADYTAATSLPVPDQFIETALIPMCIAAFLTSPAYLVRGDEEQLRDEAREAERYLRLQPGQVGAPSNRITCPIGF